jgi:hypothetical protein
VAVGRRTVIVSIFAKLAAGALSVGGFCVTREDAGVLRFLLWGFFFFRACSACWFFDTPLSLDVVQDQQWVSRRAGSGPFSFVSLAYVFQMLVFLLGIALCAGQLPRVNSLPATSRLSVSVLRNYSASLEQQFKAAGLVWGAPLYLRATKYSDAKFKLYRDGMLGLRGEQVQKDNRNRGLNGLWYTDASLVIASLASLSRTCLICFAGDFRHARRREGNGPVQQVRRVHVLGQARSQGEGGRHADTRGLL